MSSNSTVTSFPPGYVEGSWWYYAPNKGAPVVFATLFAVSGIWHVWQCIHFHSWKATGAVPIAALIFVAGYVIREVAAFNYQNVEYWVASTIILLCSPPVYEAANFFTLGRILYYVPYHAPMHPGRVVLTFGVLSTMIESIGTNGGTKAISPNLTNPQQPAGRALLQTALVLQLFSMACFTAIAVRYEYNCRRAGMFPDNLRGVMRVLYVSCGLISVRTLYRCVEWFEVTKDINAADPTSFPPSLRHEWLFWVFEASMMLSNSFLLNIFHPSHFLPRNLKIYLGPDGVTEIEGEGFEDRRKWWWTLIDPADIRGLFRKGGRQNDAWARKDESSTAAASDQGSELTDKVTWGKWKQDSLVQIV